MLARAVFSVSLLCFGRKRCFDYLFLVVSTSAVDCLERLVSEMTCYVSSGTLNPTHSLTQLYVFVFSCSCPVGFEGPRCQQTKITFTGNNGYMVLKPLESRETDKLSFEFMTTTSTGHQLLLYTGPVSDPSTLRDFMAVELVNGFPQLRLSLGEGEIVLPDTPPSAFLNDGNWHSVEVFRMGKVSRAMYSPFAMHVVSSKAVVTCEIKLF